MTITLNLPDTTRELKPRIMVIGVGGAGGNAVSNMIGSGLEGVEFVVANTDAQALEHSPAERKIQMGVSITQGLGAGSHPEIGRAAAEEALPEILENLHGCHMVFVTAGMGGGTGTGASPIIAQAAREQGILTLGVVTKPFQFEGSRRMRIAEDGTAELQKHVDTLLVIPNQNLFRIADETTTFADAFSMADRVLHSGVSSITDLMVKPGLINLDFADVKSVMNEMGKAMMGTGEASGERRSLEAAQAAITNPLLDDVTMRGARGVLINITGGPDMTLFEVDEAANHIRTEVDEDCNIIIGSTFSPELEGKMRVAVVATGIDGGEEPEREDNPWDSSDNGTMGKVCSIHSMRPAERRSAQMEASSGTEKSEVHLGLSTRKPISLGKVERTSSEHEHVRENFGSHGDTIGDVAEGGNIEEEAEVIFNTPSESEAGDREVVDVIDDIDGAKEAAPPTMSAAKQERGSFWNFWFRGSRQVQSPSRLAAAAASAAEISGPNLEYDPDEDESRAAEDQLEIPAFLRRQAN
ncbi:MAG: cell division protein FtsZ [Hyphomicrobiales bacterium]|nr:cell division protein FtsZ [Hyphomicrobiales bacterium]MCY4032417.1 cell division protein FtsZ [Hyphomicrobiales bacterium]